MPRPVEIGTTRGSYIYPLRLPDELREEWTAYCGRNDKKSAATLRALMRYMIRDDMPDEVRAWIAAEVEQVSDTTAKSRLEIRLTQSEYEAVRARSEAEGTSVQRYVVNCVRASLTNSPQFTMAAIKALWESSYQLKAIGRNLNQIAKALNMGEDQAFSESSIKGLSQRIQRHTDQVAELLDASLGRWRIKA